MIIARRKPFEQVYDGPSEDGPRGGFLFRGGQPVRRIDGEGTLRGLRGYVWGSDEADARAKAEGQP